MGKHGSTKEEILRQISQGSDNLSAISDALKLAPSTVSKHLHDLEAAGLIEQRDDSHVKKWKYYRLKQDARGLGDSGARMFTGKSAITAALALVIIAIIAFSVYGMNQNAAYNSTLKTNYVPISITDPPQVPSGTQALYINYSHLTAQVVNSSGSSWVSINASGRLDLMSLINESQVIGSVGIGPNYSIEAIKFNITAASITIDNITYPVYLTISEVNAKVGSKELNDSSGVLLDFSPVVMPAYASNTTIFVLVPSLRAAIVPRPGQYGSSASAQSKSHGTKAVPSAPIMNGRYPLPDDYKTILPEVNPNLSIVNATLYSSDNNTSLSVILKNNGTDNVTIMGIALYGNLTPYPIVLPMIVNGTASVNMSGYGWPGTVGSGGNAMPPDYANNTTGRYGLVRFPGRQDSDHIEINASTMYTMWARHGANSINIRLPRPVSNISISDVGKAFGSTIGYVGMPDRFRMMSMGISFMVEKNGTLELPHTPFAHGQYSMAGYLLQGHSTSTLSYNGELNALDASPPVTFVNGTTYRLVVITSEGLVQANFTAT
jgi:DNA-binding transcriptional ArsR family regulator